MPPTNKDEAGFVFVNVKSINEEARTLDAVASTSDLDRDKEIILTSAFVESLAAFRANPVILATHQHRLSDGSSPVIGSAIPETIRVGESEVTFTMRFADTPKGEEYWKLYRDRHMRAFSIGFIPIEWTDEKDEHLGYVRTYTKIELLEISAVPVPSNRRALARAKSFFEAAESRDELAEIVKTAFAEQSAAADKSSAELRSFLEEAVDDIKSLLIADSGGFADELLLGSAPDSPAADGDKTERRLRTVQNAVKNFTKEQIKCLPTKNSNKR